MKDMCLTSRFRAKLFSMQPIAWLCIGICLAFSLTTDSSVFAANGDEEKGRAEERDLKNFGKVSDHLYRGGQPKSTEYRKLAEMGIKTVIDLREDPESYARDAANGASLKYINIRLDSHRQPTLEETNLFLRLVKDQAIWPVYVHCAAGKHRTGALIAAYRMSMEGWDAERAYKEMKDFGFYSRFGHGTMKSFVFEYYQNLLARQPSSAPAESYAESSRVRRIGEGNK